MSSSAACRLRSACGAFAAVAAAGCTSWHVLSNPDVDRLLAVVHVGDTVRATTAPNATQELEIVSFEDDGTLHGVTPEGEAATVRAADLTVLEYRAAAPRKTVWLVLGAVFGASLVDAYHSCEPEGPFGKPACAD